MPTEIRLVSCKFVIDPQGGVERDRVGTRAAARDGVRVEQLL